MVSVRYRYRRYLSRYWLAAVCWLFTHSRKWSYVVGVLKARQICISPCTLKRPCQYIPAACSRITWNHFRHARCAVTTGIGIGTRYRWKSKVSVSVVSVNSSISLTLALSVTIGDWLNVIIAWRKTFLLQHSILCSNKCLSPIFLHSKSEEHTVTKANENSINKQRFRAAISRMTVCFS